MLFQTTNAPKVLPYSASQKEYADALGKINQMLSALDRGDLKGAQAIVQELKQQSLAPGSALSRSGKCTQLLDRLNFGLFDPGTTASKAYLKTGKLISDAFGGDQAQQMTEDMVRMAANANILKVEVLRLGLVSSLCEAFSKKDYKNVDLCLDRLYELETGKPRQRSSEFLWTSKETGAYTFKSIPAPAENAGGLNDIVAAVEAGKMAEAQKMAAGLYDRLAYAPMEKMEYAHLQSDVVMTPIWLGPLGTVDIPFIRPGSQKAQEATIGNLLLETGRMFVPGWSEYETQRVAVRDYKERRYIAGTVNEFSFAFQTAMDIPAIASMFRLKGVTENAKAGIKKGLAKLSESELVETIDKKIFRAFGKEFGEGVAKKTLEGMSKEDMAKYFDNALKSVQKAIADKGLDKMSKKELDKLCQEEAKKIVDPIRTGKANRQAVKAENMTKTTKEALTDEATSKVKTTTNWFSNMKKNVKKMQKSVTVETMKTTQDRLKTKAADTRTYGQQFADELKSVTPLPFLAKPKFSVPLPFRLTGKHAYGLTARYYEIMSGTVGVGVKTGNYIKKVGASAKTKLNPYFRNPGSPVKQVREMASKPPYWWARGAYGTGVVVAEGLPKIGFVGKGEAAADAWIGEKIFGTASATGSYKTAPSKTKGKQNTVQSTYICTGNIVTDVKTDPGTPYLNITMTVRKTNTSYNGDIVVFENGNAVTALKNYNNATRFLLPDPVVGATYMIKDANQKVLGSFILK